VTLAIQIATEQAPAAIGNRPAGWSGVFAAAAWLTIAAATERWPDDVDVGPTALLAGGMAAVGVLSVGATITSRQARRSTAAVPSRPRLITLAVLLGLWELVTAKLQSASTSLLRRTAVAAGGLRRKLD
jgi:hypothetical protein